MRSRSQQLQSSEIAIDRHEQDLLRLLNRDYSTELKRWFSPTEIAKAQQLIFL